jgi:hypothetical protein
MHDKAATRYHQRILQFADRRNHPDRAKAQRAQEHLDWWLDQYADNLLRATEWDAEQWGFDPDRWMEKERADILNMAHENTYPREVI